MASRSLFIATSTIVEWIGLIMLVALVLLFTSIACAQDPSLSLSLAAAATTVPLTVTDAGAEIFKEEAIQCEEPAVYETNYNTC